MSSPKRVKLDDLAAAAAACADDAVAATASTPDVPHAIIRHDIDLLNPENKSFNGVEFTIALCDMKHLIDTVLLFHRDETIPMQDYYPRYMLGDPEYKEIIKAMYKSLITNDRLRFNEGVRIFGQKKPVCDRFYHTDVLAIELVIKFSEHVANDPPMPVIIDTIYRFINLIDHYYRSMLEKTKYSITEAKESTRALKNQIGANKILILAKSEMMNRALINGRILPTPMLIFEEYNALVKATLELEDRMNNINDIHLRLTNRYTTMQIFRNLICLASEKLAMVLSRFER